MKQDHKKYIINIQDSKGLKLPAKKNNSDAYYDVWATSEPEVKGELSDGSNYEGHLRPNNLPFHSIDYIQYRTGLFVEPVCVQKSVFHLFEEKIASYLHLKVLPRSSVSKYNLLLANSQGIIDHDYRMEILIRFKYVFQPKDIHIERNSDSFYMLIDYNKIYNKGDRICQLTVEENNDIVWNRVEKLDETDRGGFGSTGEK